MNKTFALPVNNLSFGFVSFGILNELYKRNENFNFVNIGDVNLSSFDKIREDDNFKNWLSNKNSDFLETFSRKNPLLKLWHISGSENSVSNKNCLFTFHELDQITPTEKNLLNNQDVIFVTSKYSKDVFEEYGVTSKIRVVPIGFDDVHFREIHKKHNSDICNWNIMGKFENRKRTKKTIQAWIKKFGNNPKHCLNTSIYNPHFKPEDNNKVVMDILDGKPRPFNLNIYPFFETLDEVNKITNACDIFIDLSGGESWSIPSFTAVCLGKIAVVANNTGMKEWANEKNSFLVEPSGKIPSADNIFFREGDKFNQGNFFDYDEEEFISQCDKAYETWLINPINKEGKKVKEICNWTTTVDAILEELKILQ